MPEIKKLNDYDNEPVVYCSKCYSLKIQHEELLDTDCCGECGCTNVKTSSIQEWENLYKERYGHSFVTSTKDIRRNPIFKMPVIKLQDKVYNAPDWKEICLKLYPNFPEGIGRADSVMILFSKLYDDKRLDDLRTLLVKLKK